MIKITKGIYEGEKLNEITLRATIKLKNVIKYPINNKISTYMFDVYFQNRKMNHNFKIKMNAKTIKEVRENVMKLMSYNTEYYFNNNEYL